MKLRQLLVEDVIEGPLILIVDKGLAMLLQHRVIACMLSRWLYI